MSGQKLELANTQWSKIAGKYLCFSLSGEKYALPLLQVKEVIDSAQTTPIPNTPAHFKGIMNLRGQVIPIVDLRMKLKIGKPDASAETTIIILDFETQSIGIIVDSVDAVSVFEEKDLSLPPDIESSSKLNFITAVAKTENVMILLIDVKIMLNINDFKLNNNHQNKAS